MVLTHLINERAAWSSGRRYSLPAAHWVGFIVKIFCWAFIVAAGIKHSDTVLALATIVLRTVGRGFGLLGALLSG